MSCFSDFISSHFSALRNNYTGSSTDIRKMIPVRFSYLNGCDAAVKGQYWSSRWILSNNSRKNTKSPTVCCFFLHTGDMLKFFFCYDEKFLYHIVWMFSVTLLKIDLCSGTKEPRPGFVGTLKWLRLFFWSAHELLHLVMRSQLTGVSSKMEYSA